MFVVIGIVGEVRHLIGVGEVVEKVFRPVYAVDGVCKAFVAYGARRTEKKFLLKIYFSKILKN